jgi:WD40 repeat protein/serine/threonine protein kinase
MSVPSTEIEDLFFAASERRNLAERAAYLDEVCGQGTDIRRRIDVLLAAEPKVSQFLESPAVTAPIESGPEASIDSPGTVIGPYTLLEPIGEGGMGVVYLAEQTQPVRRNVALKIIKLGMDTRQVIARFEAERQALAVMDHPNIARVIDGGTTPSGRSYFVMDLVPGAPITEFCDRERLSIPHRLDLFILVCHAVQHAHQKGIIHRDLKPSNILVSLQDPGEPGVPRIIDFGIAKVIGQSQIEKTLCNCSAQLIGTPRYMSPEQADPGALDIDTRSDIYSLGVLLYELLTGSTPCDELTLRQAPLDEFRRIIREHVPARPSTRLSSLGAGLGTVSEERGADARELVNSVRGELDWIVMKCLEKDRTRRYETASGLARDLMRYLADQPVEACPPSLGYRFAKYSRRNRAVLATAAAVSVALVAGTTISTWQAIRAAAAEKRMAAALFVAEQHRLKAERHLYGFSLRQVQQTIEQRQVERAQERLFSLRGELGEPDTSDFAWQYLSHLALREISPVAKHLATVRPMTLSPDRRLLASGDDEGTILLTDLASGQTRLPLIGHSAPVMSLACSPDGKLLASIAKCSGSLDRHEVAIWDLATSRQIAKVEPFVSPFIGGLTFSSSGRRMLITFNEFAGAPFTVQLFDLASRPAHPVLIRSVQLQPYSIATDQDSVVAQPFDRPLTTFDAETLEARWSVPDRDGLLGWPVLSADGRRVSSDDGHSVVIWDTASGREVRRIPLATPTPEIARRVLSDDGRKLLIQYKPTRLSVFDLAGDPSITPCDLLLEKPEQYDLQHASFSPDGSKLAVITRGIPSDVRLVTVWESATGRLVATYPGQPHASSQILFAFGGESVILNGDNGVKRWWFERSRNDSPQRLSGHLDEAWSAAFSPDGCILATGSDDTEADETIKLWDAATGRLLKGWRADPGTVAALAFSPDGRTLASATLSPSENVRLWEAATGRLVATLQGHTDQVRSVAFSPGGSRLASAGSDRTIRLWDAATGNPLATCPGHLDQVRSVAFSPDGRTLASASNDRTVRLWDVATGRERRVCRGLKKCAAVAFAPDGSILGSADEGGDITLWNPVTGESRTPIHGDLEQLFTLTFSPDGRTLAAAGSSRVIRIWDVVTGQELLTLPGHAAQINAVAFSPDGRTLASCSHDGAVKLWRSEEQRATPRNP